MSIVETERPNNLFASKYSELFCFAIKSDDKKKNPKRDIIVIIFIFFINLHLLNKTFYLDIGHLDKISIIKQAQKTANNTNIVTKQSFSLFVNI